MAGYFDDHDLSETDSHSAPSIPSHQPDREVLSQFTSPVPFDVSALPPTGPLFAAVTMLDHYRVHAHHSLQHQDFLHGLINELLGVVHTPSGPPPTSPSFISTLPQPKSIPPDSTCPICTETLDLTNADLCSLPCGHIFDKECIVPWLQLRNTCPACRYELPTDQPSLPSSSADAVHPHLLSALFGDTHQDEDNHALQTTGYSSYAGHGSNDTDHHDKESVYGMYS